MKVELFHHDRIEQALANCQKKHTALYMPQAVDARLEGELPWNRFITTPSLVVTGIPTGEKEAFTIYCHQQTDFATPYGLQQANMQGLVNGAGRFPQIMFDTIYALAAAQHQHLVIPHRKLLELPSDPINIKDAEKDPRVIAILDGQARVARYLQAHAKAYNKDEIGIWHANDLNKNSPLARLLFLGVGILSLGGLSGLGGGRFAGVRNASAEGTQNLEKEIESIGDKHIKALELLERSRLRK